jgi:hypothetical protein
MLMPLVRVRLGDCVGGAAWAFSGEALFMVPDAVRFAYCYQEEKYAAGVRADLDRLKNSWDSDQYKGISNQ